MEQQIKNNSIDGFILTKKGKKYVMLKINKVKYKRNKTVLIGFLYSISLNLTF